MMGWKKTKPGSECEMKQTLQDNLSYRVMSERFERGSEGEEIALD